MYDFDIRRSLRNEVEARHKDDASTRVLDELGLRQGQVRVDLAVVNGVLKGYEIKSPADSLRRLPLQVTIYSQVLDFSSIVLVEEHRKDINNIVPDWWEIVVAARGLNDEVSLHIERAGERNPLINKRALVELLWRDDALRLLHTRNLDRGLRKAPRSLVWDKLAEEFEVDELRDAVRIRIKEMASRRAEQ